MCVIIWSEFDCKILSWSNLLFWIFWRLYVFMKIWNIIERIRFVEFFKCIGIVLCIFCSCDINVIKVLCEVFDIVEFIVWVENIVVLWRSLILWGFIKGINSLCINGFILVYFK